MRRESSPSTEPELSCRPNADVWAGVVGEVDVIFGVEAASVLCLTAVAVTVEGVKSQSTPYLTQLVHLGLPSSHYTQKSVRRLKTLSMIGQTAH